MFFLRLTDIAAVIIDKAISIPLQDRGTGTAHTYYYQGGYSLYQGIAVVGTTRFVSLGLGPRRHSSDTDLVFLASVLLTLHI